MAIQTKVNGAYQDIEDVQTPVINGARQQAEAVRAKVNGAYQDVWTAMQPIEVATFSTIPTQGYFALEDTTVEYTTYVDEETYYSNFSLILPDINSETVDISFHLSMLNDRDDLRHDINISFDDTSGSNMSGNASGYYAANSDVSDDYRDWEWTGSAYRKAVDFTFKRTFTKAVGSIQIDIHGVGMFSGDGDGYYYSQKITDIIINGKKYGGNVILCNNCTDAYLASLRTKHI